MKHFHKAFTNLKFKFCGDIDTVFFLNLSKLFITIFVTDANEFVDFFCSLSQLETLELRENLLKDLPESISRLTKLERLDLGDNDIVTLPSHLGYLPALQELWLDHNELQRLPPEIGRLTNLTCLDVSENKWVLNLFAKKKLYGKLMGFFKSEDKTEPDPFNETKH